MSVKKHESRDYGKVAVLMGGLSSEREISLESGQAVYAALERAGIDVHMIDVQPDILSRLVQGKFDRVFNALHGRGGEDGIIQGVLDTLRLPYTGSGVLGSALAMDKSLTKRVWQAYGMPTPDFIELDKTSDWNGVYKSLGLPLMVKPVHEGSSLGASKVIHVDGMRDAWMKASQFDDRVMAERWITGSEYTVPVLEGEILPMIRLVTPREFYDYEAKYQSDTTQYLCPCGLDEKVEKQYSELARDAFTAIGATGWGRVDMMIDEVQQPWLIEVNTIPGMTSHSLVPMSAMNAGISFDELSVRILDTSMAQVK